VVWESPSRPWADLSAAEQADRRELWNSGLLRYKLDPLQRRMYDSIRARFEACSSSTDRWYYLDCARRTGKDFVCSVLVAETIMRERAPRRARRIRIAYAASTQDSVKDLLVPNLLAVFEDCPPELLPAEIKEATFTKSADRLTFPWGSLVVMVGMDLHPDRLRGPDTFAAVYSECAFYADLDGTVIDVMMPMFQTEPEGWWVLNTTPSKSSEHDTEVTWLPLAIAEERHFHATMDDNQRITDATKADQIRLFGGRASTRCRRELYAEHVTEQTDMVIPEWIDAQATCVREFSRRDWLDCYASLDPGIVHFCASQQAFYDFETATLFIEGDFAAPGLNTWDVAVRLWAREWQLWGLPPTKPKRVGDAEWEAALEEIKGYFYDDLPIQPVARRWTGTDIKLQPARRVSDTDLRLIADLSNEHALTFAPARKDDLEAAINGLRLRVAAGKVVVHPRATWTRAHLNAVWNKQRTKFAEGVTVDPQTGQKRKHHFDALASLIYLDREVNRTRNPIPPEHVFMDRAQHHVPVLEPLASQPTKTLQQVFGGRGQANRGAQPARIYQRDRRSLLGR
jgi:hypothetical protein